MVRCQERVGVRYTSDRTAFLVLGAIWLVTLFLFILVHCISPLMPYLILDFKLSYSAGGILYSLPILMIALFSYPFGIVSDRIGVEIAVGCGATAAVLFALLRPFSTHFYLLTLFTGVFGLGFALCLPNLAKLVKERFPPQLAGTATGAYTTAIPLGGGVAIALTEPILQWTGSWQGALATWGLAAIPVIILWWVVSQKGKRRSLRQTVKGPTEPITASAASAEGASGETMNEEGKGVRAPRLFRSILICGLLLALLNLIFYCTMGWLPTYLAQLGWPPSSAATATSVISFIEIPAILLLPALSDRTGKRRLIIILSFLLLAVCSAIVSIRPSSTWFVVPGLGITLGGIFSLLLAMPVELVETKKVGRTAGGIISMGYGGALMGPPLAGYLRDLTGGFGVGFMVMALAGLVAAGLAYRLPETSRCLTRESEFDMNGNSCEIK
jgi:CP family cyanate transporter-like MFS transporter